MDSQPIMVPGENSGITGSSSSSSSRRTQSMSHPPNSGSFSGDAPKTMTPPGTGKTSVAMEDRLIRRGSSQVQPILAKPISKESLMANSSTWVDSPAPPLSPGLGGVFSTPGDISPKVEAADKMNESGCKLTRKESYKAQRKNYRMEKKRVAEELLSSLKDPTVVVMSDWLKVRGTLKSWTKLWCVLKPGLLLLYKSPKIKSNHWVGTVLLNTCQVIERPSKKDGFCFKLFHPLEQSIWSPRGPEKEAIGAVVQPLPTSYLIFRAPSQAAGKCWLDALELSLRCSSLIVRSTSVIPRSPQHDSSLTTHETQWSEADYEKHFEGHGSLLPQERRRPASSSLLEPPSILLSSYESSGSIGPPHPGSQRRLHSCPSPESPVALSALRSLCPSPSKSLDCSSPYLQQLCQAVTHWERLKLGHRRHKNGKHNQQQQQLLSLRSTPCSRFPSPAPSSPALAAADKSKLARGSDDDEDNDDDDDDDNDNNGNDDNDDDDDDNDVDNKGKTRRKKSKTPVLVGSAARWRRMSSPELLSSRELAEHLEHQQQHVVTLDPLLSRRGRHGADLDDTVSQSAENGIEPPDAEISPTDSESDDEAKDDAPSELEPINETPYHARENEVFGLAGEVVAELQEEQKSLIWFLIKQVRPGMDLSKVVLPTFILEPRSFLEKLADSYYHADMLSQAVLEDDAFTRMKAVVKWYLSGFYKKPQGLKKPYNPLLGETFRCYWQHPNGSRTFYLAEQLSHHPPISGFYVTNRQDGFTISASIIAKSKFYGNSTSAVLDGTAVLTMLPRGEDYAMTIPYAHCKGILMGTLSMELGGKVNVVCEKTGYNCELEFKIKPFLGGADQLNMVVGRIKLGKETLANITGYWDSQIMITDKRTGQESVFFNPTPEIRKTRLKKYTVPLEHQGEWESEKLWIAVTKAIDKDDQTAATEAKTALEEAQRERAKERKLLGQEWVPKHFVQDIITGNFVYRHADIRPWDPRNDVVQYEHDYIISTKTRHKTPIMRTGSIVSMEPQSQVPLLLAESRSSLSVLKSSKRQLTNNHPESTETVHDSASSSDAAHSDSSQSVGKRRRSIARLTNMIKHVEDRLHQNSEKLDTMQRLLEQSAARQRAVRDKMGGSRLTKHLTDTLIVVFIVFIAQFIMRFWNKGSTKSAEL